ncbi:uncharacterized protein MELLADRAFT_72403 [Melampsora larici-populina 98AG31]|uniref:Uncharacterized protein n=1 Tax=Melampsora larici-populina (strain 98AG31 / pathotype 3-4-7) TaxID=747676 RepID=F4RT87_MELLP|nr:uncharacterized protein MELLADRAFT_72403 [Melampsora larici-populina 98AG31]EGG04465.1 hypothetical protein MELLADRAFT_72403 [Melampsora larici-populina 98AG31]
MASFVNYGNWMLNTKPLASQSCRRCEIVVESLTQYGIRAPIDVIKYGIYAVLNSCGGQGGHVQLDPGSGETFGPYPQLLVRVRHGEKGKCPVSKVPVNDDDDDDDGDDDDDDDSRPTGNPGSGFGGNGRGAPGSGGNGRGSSGLAARPGGRGRDSSNDQSGESDDPTTTPTRTPATQGAGGTSGTADQRGPAQQPAAPPGTGIVPSLTSGLKALLG